MIWTSREGEACLQKQIRCVSATIAVIIEVCLHLRVFLWVEQGGGFLSGQLQDNGTVTSLLACDHSRNHPAAALVKVLQKKLSSQSLIETELKAYL